MRQVRAAIFSGIAITICVFAQTGHADTVMALDQTERHDPSAVTGCFVAGTLVETARGSTPIESIEKGNKVWSRDVDTGRTALRPVTRLIRQQEREIWIVELTADGVTTSSLETTDDHLWRIPETGWVRTDELEVHSMMTSIDGNRVRIESVTRTGRTDETYDLTVANFQTYFVGKWRVLVDSSSAEGRP